MNEEKLKLLKEKMNLSEKDIQIIKDGYVDLYIDSVLRDKPMLQNKFGKSVDDEIKEKIDSFFKCNDGVLKFLKKEQIEKIKNGGDMVLNVIPEKRIKTHNEMTKNNFQYDKITRILRFHENLVKRLKEF